MKSSNVKMSELAKELFHEIIGCPTKTLKIDKQSNCDEIISFQKKHKPLDQCQVPEPWSGDLEAAQILFIGKNPSIDKIGRKSMS